MFIIGNIVQQGQGGAESQSVGFALPHSVTEGNTILVVAMSTTPSTTLAGTVSDIAANNYTNVTSATSGNNKISVWTCVNAKPVNSSFSSAAFFYDTSGSGHANVELVFVYELSGVGSIDAFGSVTPSAADGTINITTVNNHSLIYTVSAGGGSVPTGYDALQSAIANSVTMIDSWESDVGTAGVNALDFGTGTFAAIAVAMSPPSGVVNTLTNNYNVQLTDSFIRANGISGQQQVISLPLTGETGQTWIIKNVGAGGVIVQAVNQAVTIDGGATVSLTSKQVAGVTWNGTNFDITSGIVTGSGASGGTSAAAIVQKAKATGSSSSLTVHFASNTTTGNLVLLAIECTQPNPTLTITDGSANTWGGAGIQGANNAPSGPPFFYSLFVKGMQNANSIAAGTGITVSTTTGAIGAIFATEISGVLHSGGTGGSNKTSGGGDMATPNFTPIGTNNIAYAVFLAQSGGNIPAGYTQLQTDTASHSTGGGTLTLTMTDAYNLFIGNNSQFCDFGNTAGTCFVVTVSE